MTSLSSQTGKIKFEWMLLVAACCSSAWAVDVGKDEHKVLLPYKLQIPCGHIIIKSGP